MEHTTPTHYVVIVSGACFWSYYQRTDVIGLVHDHFDMYLSEAREVMLCATEAHHDSWVPFVGFSDLTVAKNFVARLQNISLNVSVQLAEMNPPDQITYKERNRLKK